MGIKIKIAFEKNQYGNLDNIENQLGPEWRKRIFDAVLSNAVTSVHPDGLPPLMARQYARLLNAMDLAADDFIQVDRSDADFLLSILNNEKTRVPPPQVRVFCLLQDEINRAIQST